MPPTATNIPKLRKHPKGSVVVLDGKYLHCGPYGSAEAKQKYDRHIAEWLANNGSLKVFTDRGQWQRPLALGILDDHSRLCCHLQWYLSETAADLVHGLSQAIQKRGLPRALMTDYGAAMVADEVTQGLLRLGIVHERTLPYSAYQNGKQEAFWGTVEGRLMEMLVGQARQLPLDVDRQMSPRASPREAIIEPAEKPCEFRAQTTNLFGIHAWVLRQNGENHGFVSLPDLRKVS